MEQVMPTEDRLVEVEKRVEGEPITEQEEGGSREKKEELEEFRSTEVRESLEGMDLGVSERGIRNPEMEELDEAERERVNALVMDEAVNERKRTNFQSLRIYQEQHRIYYLNHNNILIWVESQLATNIQKSRVLYQETIDYFTFLKEGYRSLSRHMGRQGHLNTILAEQQGGRHWYGSLRGGLLGLLQITSEAAVSAERFYLWLQQTLIPKINQAMNAYESSIQAYQASIAGKKRIAEQCLKNFQHKFLVIERFVNAREGIGKLDLLHQQLLLSDIAKHARQKVCDWGKMLSQFWQSLQNNQSVLLHSIQKNLQLFFIQYLKHNKQTQKLLEVRELWEKMKTDDDTTQNYWIQRILVEDQKRFVKEAINKESLKNIDFEKFVQLQRYQEIIGSADSLIDGLYLKRFSCKIDNNNSQIFVYSTVDAHLIFVIQVNKKPLNKMLVREIHVKRVNHNTLEANEKQKGFIMNRWNKETLHFAGSDELEEFLFSIGKGLPEME